MSKVIRVVSCLVVIGNDPSGKGVLKKLDTKTVRDR